MRSRLAAVGIVAGVALGALTPVAQAASHKDISCTSSKGDKGLVRIYFGSRNKVTKIDYKIKVGRGGKKTKNDVLVTDHGVAPPKKSDSGDKAKGDNRWHRLRNRDYTRGIGYIHAHFIFNHPGSDPKCTGSKRI
ncbi:hypothetical protein OHR68_12600 [Spirillospora sp. NBC_00431]